MRILNFGSLNVDYVYSVEYFVRAGETLKANSREVLPGGKGLNQSVALARAGADVSHAGCIGADGAFLRGLLNENGVDTAYLRTICKTKSTTCPSSWILPAPGACASC